MLKVIGQDSAKVSDNLKQLREAGRLTDQQIQLVQNLAKKVRKPKGPLNQLVNRIYEKDKTGEMKKAMEKMQADADEKFAGMSLLFDPANPDHPMVHMLVVLSNLTWGSIQSVLGLGIVVVHHVVAIPVTWIGSMFTGGFIRPFVPNIRPAYNRMQIYADVCGFSRSYQQSQLGNLGVGFLRRRLAVG